MAGRSITLNKDILVPVGTLIAAVTLAVGIVRYSDTADATTKAQLVAANTAIDQLHISVAKLETRADRADDRWNKIIQHLAAIETALKINPNTIAAN